MSPRRKGSTLPRPVSPGLSLVPSYKAGLYAELQKFGSSKRDSQLTLWEDEPEASEITVTSGLDLSVSEDKALSAIQILLDRAGYQGTEPVQETLSPAFKWRGSLPRMTISHTEYFEAYGLDRKGDGSFYSHQAEEALEALWSLANTDRAVYYERRHWEGRKRLSDIIKAKAPLLRVTEITGYKDLDEEEAEQIKAGQDIPAKARAKGLLIECSPLLVDSVDSFYLLKPVTLHREIQQLHGSKRVSRAVSLFIEWLLTLDLPTVRVDKDTLIERLRLSKYVERRHKKIAEARIQEAVQTAKDLGYLLNYQGDPAGTGILSLTLNPERCSRVKRSKKAKEVA